MPGNIAADASNKSSDPAQFFPAVVESGNNQGQNFQPNAAFMHHTNGVGDVFESSPQ